MLSAQLIEFNSLGGSTMAFVISKQPVVVESKSAISAAICFSNAANHNATNSLSSVAAEISRTSRHQPSGHSVGAVGYICQRARDLSFQESKRSFFHIPKPKLGCSGRQPPMIQSHNSIRMDSRSFHSHVEVLSVLRCKDFCFVTSESLRLSFAFLPLSSP